MEKKLPVFCRLFGFEHKGETAMKRLQATFVVLKNYSLALVRALANASTLRENEQNERLKKLLLLL